jgi:hypothetical protein
VLDAAMEYKMLRLNFNALLSAALAAALTIATPAALFAQSTAPAKSEKSAKKMSKSDAKSDAKSDGAAADDKSKAAKPLTAQQQKMKDCGAKWQEEKKTKGVSGKAAYQKFLGTCLKGST